MSEEDQMMQAIALSLGENFPMVVDQVILVVVMMHGMFGTHGGGGGDNSSVVQ
jgi:hypothetical protein